MNITINKFLNKVIFGKFKILQIIGQGSNSTVFSATNFNINQIFACKIQKKIEKIGALEKEAYFLFQLKGIGIPKIISYGYWGAYNILIEELLGKTLEELFKENKDKSNIMRLKDLAMTGIQLKYTNNR